MSLLKDIEQSTNENTIDNEKVENQQVEETQKLADNLNQETPNGLDGNIDLSIFNKKKFSINGDTSKIIELDISDLSIINRIKELYPVLDDLQVKAAKLGSIDTTKENKKELIDETALKLKEIDVEMRDCIDKIFDFPVCKVIAPTGSMYDPVQGKFKYEHIIEVLIKLYGDNLEKEINKMKFNISKHTNKYSKKK